MNRWRKIAAWSLALVLLTLSLGSCGVRGKKAVGVCGEYEILYEELRYEALTYMEKHPDCTEEELRDAVERAILERYAIPELCKQYTPSALMDSPEMKELAESEREKAISDMGSKKELKAALEEVYLSENFFEKQLILTQMQVDLETALFADTELKNKDTLLAWLKDGNCVRIRKLLFTNIESATAAREELTKGTELEDLLQKDQFSSATAYQPDYYFRDLRQTDEEKAALALTAAGDVSAVLESDGSYVLLLRVKDDFENLTNYQAVTALERYRENRLAPLIQTTADGLSVTWNDFGAKLIFKEIE